MVVQVFDVALASIEACTDRLVCHCLGIRESTVYEALDDPGVRSVRDVMQCTGAGTGCTACHCVLKRLIARRSQRG
jgi:bacterioferritin-associated ferredoxin